MGFLTPVTFKLPHFDPIFIGIIWKIFFMFTVNLAERKNIKKEDKKTTWLYIYCNYLLEYCKTG